ncbi:methylated-DNA--[protein]-cysteine S-methyltransferase [Shimwellia blattae]|uniref:Methylated-DNA--protein-cysteine methyltransferase n=1 Tax=Shimwellia blattae (strain ATCC 29907 / DSM 4481 / JCM 1650 / NBRC 105725 / CDC 9005-74) TaxID=630626 RepID=I2B9W8_SHIBC|nr:methylated-DNA--[protein]-cysteine S-methyltransferase [Shimwellia blattae]AFJ47322.1 methylated-DNA-[protein]-cysteine S-methyltransferase [Shimwellia blattae DSM 4481 = NBRC 105725]GAB80482.1 methylated-DNA--protein-cysteine methyltransferase [Shimwellia blattae DSM 4481 = NBRC 105725]VDY64817.1 Methylated-DNA--protein-cysteine methyltransferase [Shimwellia blattae]VEC22918.1 Methylated-DNA--protein-cysteine methyltransferase [Shimwellia blattae]
MLILLEDTLPTPLGMLRIITDEQYRLRAIDWEDHDARLDKLLSQHYARTEFRRTASNNPGGMCHKLADYFAGNTAIINDLPTATEGTPFQREVWAALRTIPCGQVMHYGELATRLGRPGAARAVGAANGANPISIVVPCHRVIGSSGTLTGYAGGVQRKEWLLRHEGFLLL